MDCPFGAKKQTAWFPSKAFACELLPFSLTYSKFYLHPSTSDRADWTALTLSLELPLLRMGSQASTILTIAAIRASLSLCMGRMKCSYIEGLKLPNSRGT